eukprot:COSAG06_NODE_156_length_21863_cov_29.245405_3_plen_68_part_00
MGDERIVIMGAWKPEGMSHHPNLGGPGFATSSSPSALHHARACPLSVHSTLVPDGVLRDHVFDPLSP